MARKILENWIVWVAVDVVYIGMFLYKSLVLTAGLYAVFLVLSLMGYFQWKRTLDPDTQPSTVPSSSCATRSASMSSRRDRTMFCRSWLILTTLKS